MMKKIEYEFSDHFRKDFKKLEKRFRSLSSDLEVVKKNAVELFHVHGVDNRSIFPVQGFCNDDVLICKVRKFACKSLKGGGVQSGIRLIYAYLPGCSKVIFLEIYFKGDKENEDRSRISEFLSSWPF